MAEEQLNLVDGMSASLRRIYQEAERLNKRMLTLKSNIKALEKPMSMSYLRRELKATEQQAQQTERAIKAMVRAEALNSKYGAFKVGANGVYYVNGIPVPNSNRAQMAENYVRNVANGKLRRDRLLWENGRMVNGLSFDQRLAKTNPLFATEQIKNSTNSLNMNLLRLATTALILGGIFSKIGDTANEIFVKPQSQYISNLTRVALTNDRNKTLREMMNELYDTASRTRAPADATFMLYNRIALSGVKASNERIRRFVESFNKVTAISGTTGQENRAVMLQLAQGIGSNRLSGDEFRSISEQAPLFKYMLAKGLGVNPGALKEMGAQGKLTAEAILSAMEKVQDQIDLIFKEAPLTIDQSVTILQNKWSKLVNEQFTGYIAIRDLIKDITIWMDTPKGQEIITNIIHGWNKLLFKTTEWIRRLAPLFIWMVQHIKLLGYFTLFLLSLWAPSKWFRLAGGVVKSFKIITVSGASMWSALSAGAVSFRAVCSAVLGWISLIIEAMILAWNVGQKIADHIQEQREIKAESFDEEMLARNKEREWRKYAKRKMEEQKLTYVETSSGIGTKEASVWNKTQKQFEIRSKWEKEFWNPIETDIRNKHDQWQKDNNLGKYRKTVPEGFDELEKIRGMADSSKNIPMVGKVNEVGKINDKVSIDNDGIEMMKTIAERQWVMQNEVTVPQKVEVQITKEVDVSEDRIAEVLTGGTKIAVASSMRGAATT